MQCIRTIVKNAVTLAVHLRLFGFRDFDLGLPFARTSEPAWPRRTLPSSPWSVAPTPACVRCFVEGLDPACEDKKR